MGRRDRIHGEVADLPELIEVNPFDYIKLSWEGESPHIRPFFDSSQFLEQYDALLQNVMKNSFGIKTVSFHSLGNKDEYETGDKITIAFEVWSRLDSVYTDDDVVELCKEAGYLITHTEKEYTIE